MELEDHTPTYFDPNVALINQSNVMQEAGFGEGPLLGTPFGTPINDTNAAYFQRFTMMQDGADMQQYLRFGTLLDPIVLGGNHFRYLRRPRLRIRSLALPDSARRLVTTFYYVTPDSTVNTDPTVTVNSYDQLANDPILAPIPTWPM